MTHKHDIARCALTILITMAIPALSQAQTFVETDIELRSPLPQERSGGKAPPRSQITIANPSSPAPQASPLTRRNLGAFFDKLRAGKAVTIAYLGGSTAAGLGAGNPEKTSYRAIVTDWIRKRYPKSEITEINSSVPGTGSLYGALRARRDVIAYKPDLVFVDFAVSDANEDEVAVKKAIEGLLRQFLIVPQPPEVVMLYTTTAAHNTRIDWHDTIAAYYQIPSINLQDQIWTLIDSARVKPADYWTSDPRSSDARKDSTITTDAGHRVYADLIIAYLTDQEKLPATPITRNIASPAVSDEMNYGEFKAIAEIKHDAVWRNESNSDRTLPTTLLTSEKVGAQIEYYFEGSVVGLSYRMGPDCGTFEVLIDGKPAPAPLARIDCYDTSARIGTRIIAGGLGPGEHKLTVRVLNEKNSRSSGNFIRLGYLLVGGTRPERL